MWMDLRVLLLLQSRTKEQDGYPTNAKCKRFMKNEDTACYCKCCSNYIPAVSTRVSLLCFLHDIAFGTQTIGIYVFVKNVTYGSDGGRHSKSCCKTPLGSMAVSTAWQISRGPATSSTTGVWHCALSYIYQEQKKWWENVIFNVRVLSRLTVALTWAASLGCTSAVTCCHIYSE